MLLIIILNKNLTKLGRRKVTFRVADILTFESYTRWLEDSQFFKNDK